MSVSQRALGLFTIIIMTLFIVAGCNHENEDNPEDTNIAPPASDNLLLGRWGYSRLRHKNSGQWALKFGEIIFNEDGTGSNQWQQNNSGALQAVNNTFSYSVLKGSDGSFIITRLESDGSTKVDRYVLSDDGQALIVDGAATSDRQFLWVGVKIAEDTRFSLADLQGDYYGLDYRTFLNGTTSAGSSLINFDGHGEFTIQITFNRGSGLEQINDSGVYSVSASHQFMAGPFTGFFNANAKFGVAGILNNNNIFNSHFYLRKADQSYELADIEGQWAFVGFGDHDITNPNVRAEFGHINCDADGQCLFSLRIIRSDGTVDTIAVTEQLTLAADGSLSGGLVASSAPSYGAVVGSGGNIMLINTSTGFSDVNSEDRAIGLAIRCSECSSLILEQTVH